MQRLLRCPRDNSETDRELPRSELAWHGTRYELGCSDRVTQQSHAQLIAEAARALAAAKRLVDEQSTIVRRLEQMGACNGEAVDLLNNLRELQTARERRLARLRTWPASDNAA